MRGIGGCAGPVVGEVGESCSCPVDLSIDALGCGPRVERRGEQRFRSGIHHLRHRVGHGPSPVPVGLPIVPHRTRTAGHQNQLPATHSAGVSPSGNPPSTGLAGGLRPNDDLADRSPAEHNASVDYHFPFVLGFDLAGVVAAVGPGVTRWQVGDQVFGMSNQRNGADGTYAEYCLASS